MKRCLFRFAPALLLLLAGCSLLPALAQSPGWKDYVDKTFVFEITNREAEKLLRSDPRDSLIRNMLHTQVAEFTEQWENPPAQGHFVFARIRQNRVDLEYVPVMPFNVFLYKEYGVLTLQVADGEGAIRRDAKVRINKRWRLFNTPVSFDTESQTYRIDDWSEKKYRMLTVELGGFRAVFDLTKHLVHPWYGGGGQPYSPDFYSYMITDKNRYKPGESVRFKSYALTGGRRPLKKELEVWIRTEGWKFRQVSTLPPYHPGGYAGAVELHDSLELKLDKNYVIQLREPRGRIVASRHFRYEDYVLYDNTLEIELEQPEHYTPDTNRLRISVTDANGLRLPDATADVAVIRRSVERSHIPVLILPDTMLFERITLDNANPTTVEIPASVFGEADGIYEVRVTVVTLDGQRMDANEMARFFRTRHQVVAETRGDTIRFEYLEAGKPKRRAAELFRDDAKTGRRITLPYEERFNQALHTYRFNVEGLEEEQLVSTGTIDPQLELEGGIRHDSLQVLLINPLQLDVSWYIYQGNMLVAKGFGKEIDFELPGTDLEKVHYVEVFYFMGGSEYAFRRSFLPRTEFLTVESDLPERVFPGQKVKATIRVSDHMGYPVRNADLTAFAWNGLLGYEPEDLSHFGPQPQPREQRSSYSIDRKDYRFSLPLDYAFWRKIASLDALDYYRFAYPRSGLFRYTVETPDGTTQFAPYVVKDGAAVDLFVIEDNGRPVYFSWTEQPQAYSFPVDPAQKHKITLRLHDRALVIDSLEFQPGRKTILSLDPDRLPEGVATVRLDHRDRHGNYIFNRAESDRYSRLISVLPIRNSATGCYLRQDGDSYLVYHPLLADRTYAHTGGILTGPIPARRSRYWNNTAYRHEGGYRYAFEGNVVYKYPYEVTAQTLRFSSQDRIATLDDFFLSPTVLERKIREIGYRQRYWQPANIHLSQHRMELNFRLPADADTTGVANLIFLNREDGGIVYPDRYDHRTRKYPDIRPGRYDAVLVYNSARYLRYDNIPFTRDAYTEVDMTRLQVHPADSLSHTWLKVYSMPGTTDRNSLPDSRTLNLFRRAARGYTNTVSGFVTDAQGEALIGATVAVKGTAYGTTTDIDGFFELEVDGRHRVLLISYIGYIPKELTAAPGTLVKGVLEEDARMLDEVVVIGYGTSKQYSLTGAVSGVSGMALTSSSTPPPQSPPEGLEEDQRAAAEAEERIYRELLTISGLRSNFSDVGFWEPALVTDRKGEASFTVTFPDNITRWDAVVYAMNRRLKTGTFRRSVRSYKPLMAELRMPQFLVAGDSSVITGNIRNYTADGTIEGNVVFARDTDTLVRKAVTFTSSHPDRIPLTAPAADSLSATYLFTRNDGYADGEKRTIPVLEPGTETAEGSLGFLRDGERIDVSAAAGETVEVIVTGNQLDIYLSAADYLYGYRYACNEQLGSKLIGLLNLRLYAQYKGERFRHDRQVNDIIRRLTDNRNENKLWSWWGNSSATSFWMSAHILNALKMAKDQGYTVNLDMKHLEDNYFDVDGYRTRSFNDIDILHALSNWGVSQPYGPAVEYWEKEIRKQERFADSIARRRNRERTVSYLREKLLLWEIRQTQNLEFAADSVEKYLRKDVLGAVYCHDGIKRYWYGNELATTLIAYRMVRRDSTLMHYREPMQMYILGTKSHGWNTYQSALALGTLFPDLLTDGSGREVPTTLRLTGRENRTVTEYPYRTVLAAGERLGIEKGEGVPLIYSAFTRKLRTEAHSGEAFDIETRLTGDGSLHVGRIDTLVVNVRVKQKNAEHVMIEVPIPAGCDYAAKPRGHLGPEVHREYFREKTVIFCERMPEGKYLFRIALLPRFSGRYSLNPAKAELMYFPVVHSNNALEETRIE